MEYHEAANLLFDLRRFAPRPGTDATADLLSYLGNPQEDLTCVQVAGSNGKGSTARMVESICREAGLTVGLYTSPHLVDVKDRVSVDGRSMTEAALVEYVEQLEPYVTEGATDGEAPTFFETVTAMALWEFGRRDVDVAVLEVGIGGSLDATSVVAPVASAVTSVTLEHTEMLGDTRAEIARDMAGIAPEDGPLVSGATGSAHEAIVDAVGDPVTVARATDATDADVPADPDVVASYEGRDELESMIVLEGNGWALDARVPLLGAHQASNAGVAVTLAREVADPTEDDLRRGLRNAHWPGRFEVLGRDPLLVLDGAHNPGGCECVADTLDSFDYDDCHLVVGAMADKDHRGIAQALADVDHVVACEPDRRRAEDDDVLAQVFAEETRDGTPVETRADVAGAMNIALDAADEDDCVLVTGSLYAVAEARERWTRPKVPKHVDDIVDATEVLDGAHVTDAGVWRMRGKAVHRVLKTRVRPVQARYLKEEMLSLGGECALSGVDDEHEEYYDAVLIGSLSRFKRLAEKLQGQPHGLAELGEDVRHSLGIQTSANSHGYPWEDGTAVMGILNVTPDSFYDGGEFAGTDAAVSRAEEMVAEGADIIDVGGESTRPGADPVPVDEERDRVIPVIEAIADLDVAISIDTRKAAVARAALEAGADILNDVSGLADPEMRLVAAEYDVPVVVMHSIDAPVVPGKSVDYDDVVEDVVDALTEKVLLAEKAGLARSQILVDPGLGFGKSGAESFELLGRLGEFEALGCPILVGHSRKSMFEAVDREAGDRLEPTVAATALAAERGADVVRVHDVAENRAAVDVVDAAADGTDQDT
ncbi:dihydropteroate synthase [Halobacteriales archaeon Cl-PHB]